MTHPPSPYGPRSTPPSDAQATYRSPQEPVGYDPIGTALPKRSNGPGLAALILGIAAILAVFLPFASLLGVAGVIVGTIGLALADRPRRAAAWGTALSAVSLAVPFVSIAIYIVALFAGASGPDG